MTLGAVCVVAAATLALVYRGELHWILALLVTVNPATLALYGWDKLCARRGWRRVPETALHLFSLAGGTPAAFLGQVVFRHKTRKRSFRLLFWLIVAAQAALVAWLLWRAYGSGEA